MPKKSDNPPHVTLAISDVQFTHQLRATGAGDDPVKENVHLLLHGEAVKPDGHRKVQRQYFINLLGKAEPPGKRTGGRFVGRIAYFRGMAKAFLYVRPEMLWDVLNAVKAESITHIILTLEPTDDKAEDLVVAYEFGAQEETDLLLQQLEP